MAELQFAPLTDDLASLSVEHENTVTTPAEVLGATVSAGLAALPTPSMSRSAAREALSGVAPTTNYTGDMSYDPENENLPHKPTVTMDPTDANQAIDKAGAKGMTPFTTPTHPDVVKSLIDDYVTGQQRADVIQRNGNSILSGGLARFGVGALLSLVDPLNDVAMLIPAAPEAFVAEKIAAAGSAVGRTGVRAAAGAANGALGMALLEPLQAFNDYQEHHEWDAGEALRNIAFGAALGAGGHALLGGLTGRVARLEPEDREAALRAAVADVVHDVPVRAAPILDTAALTREADFLAEHAEPPRVRPSAFDPAAHDLLPTIDAYHGTPHDFDRFDTAHIGNGEGAQAFGHGLYFAESEGVARSYQVAGAGGLTLDGKLMAPDAFASVKEPGAARALEQLYHSGTPDKAIHSLNTQLMDRASGGSDASFAALKLEVEQAKSWLASNADRVKVPDGNLLSVKLRGAPEDFLDWDKSLSEQSPKVREALQRTSYSPRDTNMSVAAYMAELETNREHATREGDPAALASAELHDAGIRGVRYLDGDSRGAGIGTNNYVMFNHEDVKITHKNGVPVAEAVAELRAQAQATAREMATERMNPTPDPEIAAAERANAHAVESAPKVEPEIEKQAAEAEALHAEAKAAYDAEVASGRMQEHPTLADVGKDIIDEGKASADYATCLVARGI